MLYWLSVVFRWVMKFSCLPKAAILGLLLLSCFACWPSPNPTPNDRTALEELRKRFGERYEFTFLYDVYVQVRARMADAPTQEEATQMVRIFRSYAPIEQISFDKEGRLKNSRHSHIAYFNFYNWEGKFLFRVYWNPQNSAFEFSEQQFPS